MNLMKLFVVSSLVNISIFGAASSDGESQGEQGQLSGNEVFMACTREEEGRQWSVKEIYMAIASNSLLLHVQGRDALQARLFGVSFKDAEEKKVIVALVRERFYPKFLQANMESIQDPELREMIKVHLKDFKIRNEMAKGFAVVSTGTMLASL